MGFGRMSDTTVEFASGGDDGFQPRSFSNSELTLATGIGCEVSSTTVETRDETLSRCARTTVACVSSVPVEISD